MHFSTALTTRVVERNHQGYQTSWQDMHDLKEMHQTYINPGLTPNP